MATNTSATSQNHNGTGSQANFAISFPFLLNSEIEVTVGGVLKTLGTHYNIVGSEVQFTSGNEPASGTANVVFNRDTNISTKRVDFEDGSVLTEADLDNNVNQVLFAQQELSNDYVKRDGTQTVTGDLVFEGSADDANETTLSITNPTADRTITVPDRSGTIITSGDTGTVTNTMLAGNSVDSSKIIDGSIVNADVNASAAIAQSKLNIANATTSAAGYQSAADKTKLDGIESNATQDQTASEIRTLIASDPLTSTHLAANSVDSSELVDGSVDHSHLSDDCVDGDNIQDDSIDNEHIAANAVRVNEIKDGEITSAKLNPSTVITSSEQGSATTNDTSFLTSAAADARFFNISSGDTIKDGQTFPDNDTTIATTAAINDRIIDIVNDVGGFDIVESEQHFPNTNPQGQAGSAAVLSIKAATTNLVPSGTTVTIVNGNIADNANITITGVTSTIPSGFGFIVESTNTLHTYSFHRLVPKATEVTTVAGKAVEIGRLGTADAVADMAILGTTDVVADMNTLATADIVSDMNTLATTDVVNDMNTLAVTSVVNNMDTVATNVTNVNNVGNNITNVNNLTNSTGANQTFTVTVQNVSGNKYFIDGVQTPVLKLARGKTYTFNLADSSNSGHPLAFRDSSDNSYTTGVTTSGTAGSSGATVVIVVAANAPSSLKYYCTSHGNAMGNTINVIDDNVGAVAGALTNVNFVGGSITNVNNVGGSISNVNTVATNINNVNDFFDKYRVGANNPTTSLDTGDLFFNTTSNSLKVYTGSAWVDGVTTTGNFALKTGNTFTGSNLHNDDVKSIYGTGSDLEIFHTGTHGVIDNITGALFLKTGHATSGITLQNRAGNETMAVFLPDAQCQLHYDNVKKLETTTTGVKIPDSLFEVNKTGGNAEIQVTRASGSTLTIQSQTARSRVVTTGGSHELQLGTNGSGRILINDTTVDLPQDNQKLRIGAGQDLQIFHDSSHSYIEDAGTGELRLKSNIIRFQGTNGEPLAVFEENSAVALYFNNSIKFNTNAAGVRFYGNLRGIDNEKLQLGTSQDLNLSHDGTDSIITHDTGSGLFRLNVAAGGEVRITKSGPESMARFIPDGAVELYYDNSKKFETTSTGATVTGNLTATGNITGANTLTLSGIAPNIVFTETNGDPDFKIQGNAGKLRFTDTTNNVERMTINTDGHVDIAGNLDVGAGVDVTGNITVTGTVDGVDIAALNTTVGNISTEVVNDTSPQLGGDLASNGNNILIADTSGTGNNRLKFGDSGDLAIFHDGSNSKIVDSGTGSLIIQTSNFNLDNAGGTENILTATENGAVELYYDNSKTFETTASGVSITGGFVTTGNSTVNDNGKISFGTGNDLQIFHDGSTSVLKSASHPLAYYSNTRHHFLNGDGSENMAVFVANGQCELYYDNSRKFMTEGAGVKVFGHVIPSADNTHDLGLSSLRWRNIYTNDLNLSNEGHGNDVDGTWGSYTIKEGAEDLFLINRRNGKKYKFNLTEVS